MEQYTELRTALVQFRELFVRKIIPNSTVNGKTDFLKKMFSGGVPWTAPEAAKLYWTIQPFTDKLKIIGYDFAKVPMVRVDMEKPQPVLKQITFSDPYFVIHTPYVQAIIDDIRKLTGRIYHPESKAWKVPLDQAQNLLVFAATHGFTIGDKANKIIRDIHTNVADSYKAEYVELNLPLKLPLFPFQTAGADYAIRNQRVIIADEMGLGKSQPLDSDLLTPGGWIKMGTVKLNDKLIGSNGLQIKVNGIFPQGIRDVYRVMFNDGSEAECDIEHLWLTNSPLRNWRKSPYRVKTLREIKSSLSHVNGNLQHFIPIVEKVQFTYRTITLHPYLLGVLLGDGGITHHIKFSSEDRELVEFVKEVIPTGCICKPLEKCDYGIQYKKGIQNPVKKELKVLNLFGKGSADKFIPEDYLYNSFDIRLSVFHGLIDTDGYVSQDGFLQFTSVSERLADGVIELVRSFGGVALKTQKECYLKGKRCKDAYNISINLPEHITPCRLDRKFRLYKCNKKYKPARAISEIKYIGKKPCQCISVDAPDQLYITNDYILTHNTVQAIASVLGTDSFPTLVICPKSLRYNWKDEWEKFTARKAEVLDSKINKRLPEYMALGLYDVLITNYEGVITYFADHIQEIIQHTDGDIYDGAKVKYIGEPMIGFTNDDPRFKKMVVKEVIRKVATVILEKGDPKKNIPEVTMDIPVKELTKIRIIKKPILKGTERLFNSVILDEGHECFPYDTKVLTTEGYKKIGDIVEKKLPLYVYSYNGSEIQTRRITSWFSNKLNDRNLLQIKCNGYELICTEEHRIAIPGGYKRAKDLSSGNFVLVLRNEIIEKQEGEWNGEILQPCLCHELPSGFGYPGKDDSNRNRWINPQRKEVEVFGPAQNKSVECVRVESITVLERRGGHQSAELYKSGVVYDITVADNSNYFAENILVHNCRNKTTMRYKAVAQVFREKKTRLILTGTPIVKGPEDIATLIELLGRIDEFGSYAEFIKTYTGLSVKDYKSGGQKKFDSARLQALNVKLRTSCFIRREKHQVLKELPDKFRQIIRVEIDNQTEYDVAWLDLMQYLQNIKKTDKEIERALRAEMLVRMNILKQISARGKISAVKEFVEESLAPDEKVIVFTWFLETSQALKKHFPGAVSITGQDSDEEVQINKTRFQEDPDCKMIIVSYKRGGMGHTLTASSKVILLELGWTYKDQVQAEDRAHRIGQKESVNCYYFLGRSTIDEDIYAIIDSRRIMEKDATGGTGDIETSTMEELTNRIIAQSKK